MTEVWIELTRVWNLDDQIRTCRKAVDWRAVESIEENVAKSEPDIKTHIVMKSGDRFGVTDTIDEILELALSDKASRMGFRGKDKE